MTQAIFIGRGDGYANCKLFDGYEVIVAPLPGYNSAEREARVFKRASGGGTDYGSHVLALARRDSPYEGGNHLYLLVTHGGGRELWRIPSFYDGGDLERHILAMPERLQYALFYTMHNMASSTRYQIADSTARTYAKAFVEKRLKKKKRNNRVTVEIMPEVQPEGVTNA